MHVHDIYTDIYHISSHNSSNEKKKEEKQEEVQKVVGYICISVCMWYISVQIHCTYIQIYTTYRPITAALRRKRERSKRRCRRPRVASKVEVRKNSSEGA